MSRKNNHDLSSTKNSLQSALEANRQLQAQICKELASLQDTKQQNRIAAADLLKNNLEYLKPRAQVPLKSKIPTVSQVNALTNNISDTPSFKKRSRYRYDPNRRWLLEFWTDPSGSRPEDNEDTGKRRRIEPLLQHQVDSAKAISAVTPSHPLSKQESNRIMQQASSNPSTVDWYSVASDIPGNRTAFECFQHYHQINNKTRNKEPPSRDDDLDAALLKYLALQGPQFVWDLPSSASICGLIGNGKYNHKQLRYKANTTRTVNPKFMDSSQVWDLDEQRKLVLAMKIYSLSENRYPTPVQLAAMHFPSRPTAYVGKKWERTLNRNSKMKKQQGDNHDDNYTSD